MKITQIQVIIENLLNGNLSEAKYLTKIKRVSRQSILNFARDKKNLHPRHCIAMADFLKGQATWQEYCDVENLFLAK